MPTPLNSSRERSSDRSHEHAAANAPRTVPNISSELSLSLFSDSAGLVSYIREARMLRHRFFDLELFGEPGWDILLDLYNAELAQQRLQISAVGVGSGVAPTTTIRWLTTLESKGLVRREPDPLDGRRVFAYLTPEAVRGMDAMFAALSDKMAALQPGR